VVDGNLLEDERLAPGTISATYVDDVAVAARGCWPIALLDEYEADAQHMRDYARAARTEAGFRDYLAAHVLDRPAAAAE
jgi:glutaconate CoA-transferase, subunit A